MTDLLRRIGSVLGFEGAVHALRRGRRRRTLRRVCTRRYDLLLLDGPPRGSSRGVLLVLGRS